MEVLHGERVSVESGRRGNSVTLSVIEDGPDKVIGD